VHSTTGACWPHAQQENRGQRIALIRRASHLRGCMSPRRPSKQRLQQRPRMSSLPPQWLATPTPTKRTDARTEPSLGVPTTTVAGWAQAEESNSGLISALTCRAIHHSGWLGPSRQSEKRLELGPHLSCPPRQWLSVPTTSKRRGQTSAITCRASQQSGCLIPRLSSYQRPEQRPHLSFPLPQCLVEPMPTERTEATTASSNVLPASTVAG
jgi:hypothetical protein